MLALFALPLHLALTGGMTLPQALGFAWLACHLPVAMYLSCTGRFETAHILSAALFSGFLGWMAFITGGMTSFALLWLAIVPVEAALSGSRRVIVAATLCAAAVIAVLLGLESLHIAAESFTFRWPAEQVRTVALLAGLVYAVQVALRVEWTGSTAAQLASVREERYRLVAENVSDAISLHTLRGDTVFITPSIRRLLDMGVHEALDDGLFQRVHVIDRPAFLTALNDVVTQKTTTSLEFRARRGASKPGESGQPQYVWLEMRCRPLGYQPVGIGDAAVVTVIRDISRRKAQAEEVERAREEAESASAAKTRFLANVSHELRTPLNAIIGFSDILRQFTPEMLPDERRAEYVDLIHDSGQHLLQVVNDILDMSKIETGNFELVCEPFVLERCMRECADMMGEQAKKRGVKLTLSVPDNLPEVAGDRRACKQILINLLSNAVKFTNAGGSLTMGAARNGKMVDLYVRDTGVGISQEDLPRIGTPFLQVDNGYDRNHEGTGLGLSVVKGLVALHGGDFFIESELNVGTCVTVRLPAHVAAHVAQAVTPIAAQGAAAGAEDAVVVPLAGEAPKRVRA
ncbi:ATP-binding protein [Breoghania sp. L-A4]|uniref:PAS domain-containing sensor histidine kinase n=1 Tax=Breoghania sp. L-A4 TaxID=2304600 RepID=UPI0013C2DAE3|nr:ATP-binding protein [Breoghania sp. L-A4]